MTRQECISVFRKFGFSEAQIISMVVQILGAPAGSQAEIPGLPMKAFLTPNLDIVYNNGKRHSKLEEAIKSFVTM